MTTSITIAGPEGNLLTLLGVPGPSGTVQLGEAEMDALLAEVLAALTLTADSLTDATALGKTIMRAANAGVVLGAIGARAAGNVPQSEVTNLEADLTALVNAIAANTAAIGNKADTSALTSGLAGKANTSHTHVSTDISDGVRFVTVVTGSEARPSTTGRVFWIGGSTQPTNWVDGDIWLKSGA